MKIIILDKEEFEESDTLIQHAVGYGYADGDDTPNEGWCYASGYAGYAEGDGQGNGFGKCKYG